MDTCKGDMSLFFDSQYTTQLTMTLTSSFHHSHASLYFPLPPYDPDPARDPASDPALEDPEPAWDPA